MLFRSSHIQSKLSSKHKLVCNKGFSSYRKYRFESRNKIPCEEHTERQFAEVNKNSEFGVSNEKNDIADIEIQNLNMLSEYGKEIEIYEKSLEEQYLPTNCLFRHEITPNLRAKMVDWMIEVMISFKCKDQAFFMAVSLMDRYFNQKTERKTINELHVIGVTSMFIASKYEDIFPLRMNIMVDRISHRKLTINIIKKYEQDIMDTLKYYLQVPTALEFMIRYIKSLEKLLSEEKDWIKQMAIYLLKLCLHDYNFCNTKGSKLAICSIYVALKTCEQIRKKSIINRMIISKMVEVSGYLETEIVECSKKVLFNAQNFETIFPGLINLKKTHFYKLMK